MRIRIATKTTTIKGITLSFKPFSGRFVIEGLISLFVAIISIVLIHELVSK